jgi:solute carrier family 24 (sodium/potassium/calcium exchanger), member 6
VLSPAFLCVYVVGIGHPFELLIAFACGAIAAFICAAATAHDPLTPPFWDCGTGFPLGTAIVAVYGFGVAAMWIDVFASEIVGALHFFGLLAGVHEAVLGVTILAWGNSLTDLVANTALANKSAAGTSMAMTACFAGPLFNMLLGLGIGFWAFLTDAGKASTTVEFDPVVIVGCGFILVNCAGVVATAVLERPGHWLPVRLGWAMMAWYGLYMAVILAVSVL